MPSSVNVFVTLVTRQHLEYHHKVLSESPYITSGSQIEPYLSLIKFGLFCYIMAVQNAVYVL
jgi:hypothetical protein